MVHTSCTHGTVFRRDGTIYDVGMARKAARKQPARMPRRARVRDESPTATVDVDERVRRDAPAEPELTEAARRRLAARTCGWCGSPIEIKPTGRIPTWCSPACRQRAWEQNRAAASGLAAVRVVERRVEVPVPTEPAAPARRHLEWAVSLHQLAGQLYTGSVYDRDLPALAVALREVLDAFECRTQHP